MRATILTASISAVFMLFGCGHREDRSEYRDHKNPDGSVAFHVGEAAHAIAKESAKAAAIVEKKLEKSAKEAHRGWERSSEKERDKSSR